MSYTVDESAPDISIAVPSQDADYVVGTKVAVAFSCADADGPADIAACSGTAPAGSELDTSAPGTFTFTVTSADVVGNANSKSVTYRVSAPALAGGPTAPQSAPQPAAKAPVMSALTIKPAKFRKAPRGRATVSYVLSTDASVTFTVRRKVGKRTRAVGGFTRKGKRGTNKWRPTPGRRGRCGRGGCGLLRGEHFYTAHSRRSSRSTGASRGRKLTPGRYELSAKAKGPTGLLSRSVTKPFRIT